MVLFAKVVISTLALLPFFVFIEKRLGQHWSFSQISFSIIEIGLRIYGAGTGFQSYYPEEHFLTEEYQQECTRDIG